MVYAIAPFSSNILAIPATVDAFVQLQHIYKILVSLHRKILFDLR
jgi:hypothetical protein